MTETVSVEEYREILKKQANTRGNERVAVDGYAFDSKSEADRYAQLLLVERTGRITNLVIHPVYELQAAFTDAIGHQYRAISYEGDFGYVESGVQVVEDVKGHRTEVFKLKEKLFRFRYPHISFRIIDVH